MTTAIPVIIETVSPVTSQRRTHTTAPAIAAQAYARRTWALSAQRAISLAALRPDGLAATVAELARQLDAWVGLYDATGRPTHAAPDPAPDGAIADALAAEAGAVLRRGARAASKSRHRPRSLRACDLFPALR